jgi:hypothetical protein
MTNTNNLRDVEVDGKVFRLRAVPISEQSSCSQCDLLVKESDTGSSRCHRAVVGNNDCFTNTGNEDITSYAYKEVKSSH